MTSLLRICYQTIEFGDVDIHIKTLKDLLQYFDTDHDAEKLGISSAAWPIFGVVWASGRVLAKLMVDYPVRGKRILEVGCGMALASLVLNYRLADITATDYHPSAEAFLVENVQLNKGRKIPFVRMGWEDKDSLPGLFDLVIGSDLLYEGGHVELLSGFIDRHAKPHCEVILVDPGRGHHAKFSKKMTRLGYCHTQRKPEPDLKQPFQGQILTYLR